jgi:ELWxxDGT repeat protein
MSRSSRRTRRNATATTRLSAPLAERSVRRRLFLEQLDERRVLSVQPIANLNTVAGTVELNDAIIPVTLGGLTFFSAAEIDDQHGFELWKTNGTSAGTSLVRDIFPGSTTSNLGNLTVVGNTVFFSATDGTNGKELWKTDGTSAGTVLVRDIRPGASDSDPARLVNVNGTLFFRANDGDKGAELWKSDGTSNGTVLVRDIFPGVYTNGNGTYGNRGNPEFLTNLAGKLVFSANDSTGTEVWASDGTSNGTVQLLDIQPGAGASNPRDFTPVGGVAYFRASNTANGNELWRTNGTSAGTFLVRNIATGAASSSPVSLTNVNGTLFFAADDGTNGLELWQSNGTSAGTAIVRDIVGGSGASNPGALTNVNGTLFFRASDGTNGVELWRSNGTSAGTFLVRDLFVGSYSYPVSLTNVNGTLFFGADRDANGNDLFKSDGTSVGTVLVKDFTTQSGRHLIGFNANGQFFFSGGDLAVQRSLFLSNGTSNTTNFLSTAVPLDRGSNAQNYLQVGSLVYFTANDGSHGRELWKTDGTSAGTVLVRDIRPGTSSSNIDRLTNVNGVLYFTADDGSHGLELWKSNGTSAGTVLVAEITPSSTANPFFGSLVNLNGTLLFAATGGTVGNELWASNGSSAGTALLADIRGGAPGSFPSLLTVVGTDVFFNATTTAGAELWKTNGTSAGTVLVRDIQAGAAGSNPSGLTNVNGTLFFTADDGTNGIELWQSNGTSAGTTLVRNISTGSTSTAFIYFTNVNGTLYFTANDATHGFELWRSNGTSAGTTQVTDIATGNVNADPKYLTNVNGTLFFSADDVVHGRELWKVTAPTSAAVLVRDIFAGTSGSAPSMLTNVNGTLYFAADDGAHGREFWRSDATSLGTILYADILPGSLGSNPTANAPAASLQKLTFFTANDGLRSNELWAFNDVNTAPVLNAAKSPLLTAEAEDSPTPVGAVGTLVSTLVDFAVPAGQVDNVADLDAGAKLGIALTGADTSNGTWFYSLNNGATWLAVGTVDNTEARLLAADAGTRLYFKPNADFNGTIATALTFRAWDQTIGTNGGFVTTVANGGTTAFSTATDTVSLVITAVNDAPVLNAAKTPVLNPIVQNTPAPVNGTLSGTSIGALVDLISPAGQVDNVTDVDTGALLGIAIVAADTSHGSWFFSVNSGNTWQPLGTPSASAARLIAVNGSGLLHFAPTAGFSGTINPAITFRAWDRSTGSNGGTASVATNGGTSAFSAATDTLSLLVNDAPTLDANKTPVVPNVAKNSGNPVGAVGFLTSQLVDFANPAGQVDNVADVNAGALLGIAVTRVDTTQGVWFFSTNNGSTWTQFTAGTTQARLLAVNGQTRLYFKPNANFTGTINQAISFRAWDRTTGGNGSTADVTNAGGTTAFSKFGDTVNLTVV